MYNLVSLSFQDCCASLQRDLSNSSLSTSPSSEVFLTPKCSNTHSFVLCLQGGGSFLQGDKYLCDNKFVEQSCSSVMDVSEW